MLIDPTGRPAIGSALGAARGATSHTAPTEGAQGAHQALRQDFGTRFFEMDIATRGENGDTVDLPGYLNDVFADLKTDPSAELMRFASLFSMTMSRLGYDEDAVEAALRDLLDPVVDALNDGAKADIRLVAAALIQRSMVETGGTAPSLAELAKTIDVKIIVEAAGSEDDPAASEDKVKDIVITTPQGAVFDLDRALFSDLPGEKDGRAPSLRQVLEASVTRGDGVFAQLVGKIERVDAAPEDGASADKTLSKFLQSAKSVLTGALSLFRHELSRTLQALGLDAEAVAGIVQTMAQAVQDKLASGENFVADLMVAAAEQRIAKTSEGEHRSFRMTAQSVSIEVNHDTGQVTISDVDLTVQSDTVSLAHDGSRSSNDLQTNGAAPMLDAFKDAQQAAIRDLLRQFAATGDDDGGAPASGRSEIAIRDLTPGTNGRGERTTRMLMDFTLTFGDESETG